MPSGDFHVVPVPPFVVIGDEPLAQVERRAHGTVEWAFTRLQQEYFPRSPEHTIDIWLFQNADSYRRHSRQLFGIDPSTPFGYFSQPNHALVMNISTGGGTLVHELVHPLMAANFPQCPAWFDEGLASLYEQCGDRDGRIWGYPNWRLRGLQRAIRAGQLARFETLCRTTSREFYDDDREPTTPRPATCVSTCRRSANCVSFTSASGMLRRMTQRVTRRCAACCRNPIWRLFSVAGNSTYWT